MINLRYHLLSIVAVFLALAIGVVMGVTIIANGVESGLEAGQEHLEHRIDQTDRLNEYLQGVVDRTNQLEAQTQEAPLSVFVPDALSETPVVVIAETGVDDELVHATETMLTATGADLVGTMWLSEQLRSGSDTTKEQLVALYKKQGKSLNPDQAWERVISDISKSFILPTTPAPDATDGTDTATTTSKTNETTDFDIYKELINTGLIVYSPGPASTLTENGFDIDNVRFVFVAGPGAAVPVTEFFLPLITSLADRAANTNLVVAEIGRLDQIPSGGSIPAVVDGTDPLVYTTGQIVDVVRNNTALMGKVSTVDNLDTDIGNLAVALAVRDITAGIYGNYGVLTTAGAPLPELTLQDAQ